MALSYFALPAVSFTGLRFSLFSGALGLSYFEWLVTQFRIGPNITLYSACCPLYLGSACLSSSGALALRTFAGLGGVVISMYEVHLS